MPEPDSFSPLPDEPEDLALGAVSGRRTLRVARAGFDRLEIALADSRLSSRAALGGVATLGSLRAALSGRWPALDEVAKLFHTGRLESRRIALGIAANEARNRLVVRRCSGRSLAPFAPWVRFRNARAAAELRPPLVLVTAHVGALYLLSLAMDRLAGPRVVLRWSAVHEASAEVEIAPTSGGLATRTEALRRGLDALRAGKFVVIALEGPHGASEPGTLLGRPLALGRGSFALARISGACVAPVAALWEGNRAVVEVGSPLQTSKKTPLEVTRWFDALLCRSPRQIHLGLLRRLLFEPTVEPAGEHAFRS